MILDQDIQYDRFINGTKSDARVKATHIPTGKSVVVFESLSFHKNQQLARKKLEVLVDEVRTRSM